MPKKKKNYKEDFNFDPGPYFIEQEPQKCCTKSCCLNFCRKFVTFMISRVGLMILMVGYVLAGGLIFEAIESGNEARALKLSESELEKMLIRIYRQIENNSTRVRDLGFYYFLKDEIRGFSEFFTNGTLNGTLTGNVDPQWDFFGSVFYCVTLVSTIGYGHITCKTKLGKIFTIIYSAIGIPLMMLFLANTGSSTATVFKFIYLKFTACKNRYKLRKLKKITNFNIEYDNQDYENKSNYETNSNEIKLDEYMVNASANKEPLKSSIKDNRKRSFFNSSPTKVTKINESVTNLEENNKSKSAEDAAKQKRTSLLVDSEIKPLNLEIDNKGSLKKKKDNHSLSPSKIKKSSSITIGIRNVEVTKDVADKLLNETIKKENDNSLNINYEDALKRIDGLIDTNSLMDDNKSKTVDFESISQKNKSILELSSQKYLNFNSDSESEQGNFELDNDYILPNIFETKELRKGSKVYDQIRSSDKSPNRNDGLHLAENQKANPKFLSTTQSEILSKKESNNSKELTHTASLPEGDKHIDKDSEQKQKKKGGFKSFRLLNRKKKVDRQMSIDEKIETPKNITQNDTLDVAQEESSRDAVSLVYRNSINETFKKNLNRSIYSYDYSYGKTSKGHINFKAKQMPIYNKKQLHLIYRQFKQERQKKIGVPMLTTLIIMPCYLFCGMLIFSSFENWSKLDALYFCFITLTTVGFGDLIPGSTLLNKNGNKNNLYISALYIFVGLILIAMCINLMNRQLKNKIKSIARKIGLTNC